MEILFSLGERKRFFASHAILSFFALLREVLPSLSQIPHEFPSSLLQLPLFSLPFFFHENK
jgi:hypothetical protein